MHPPPTPGYYLLPERVLTTVIIAISIACVQQYNAIYTWWEYEIERGRRRRQISHGLWITTEAPSGRHYIYRMITSAGQSRRALHASTHGTRVANSSNYCRKIRSIWKMLGPFTTASRLTPIHQVLLVVLSRAASAPMSTTTTTTTTRDRGDRYGPMEWAQ